MMKVARMMIKLAVLTAVTVTVIDSLFCSVSSPLPFYKSCVPVKLG